MKKTSMFTLTLSSLIFVSLYLNYSCYDSQLISTDLSYNNLKAISIRELQLRISEGDNETFKKSKSFFGITRLYGFVWDETEGDLILIGEVNENKPPLHFDDFVVSLRNVYCLYCEREGNTFYYRDPSCTIDPEPETWAMLDDIFANNQEDASTTMQTWREICEQPQSVGVFGIPHRSHLASVMVIADYLLKDIANGNLKVNVDGFKSLHQVRRELAEAAMKSGYQTDLGSPTNRFEITAANAYFKNSENLYLLHSLPLILVTEEEYLSGQSFAGTGKSNPQAEEFAESFTHNYQEIANHFLANDISVFEKLKQSYRVFAIAKAIEESNIITDTSFFSVLFQHYPLDSYNVPHYLNGRSRTDQVSYSTSDAIYTQLLYSCGGVNLKSTPQRSMIRSMKNKEIMHSVIHARPGSSAVEWNANRQHARSWVLNINRSFTASRPLNILLYKF